MTSGTDTYGSGRQTQLSNTIAAIFATEHDAREGIKELHKAGFRQTWLGLIKKVDGETGEPLVDDKQGLGSFFSADRLPLAKALMQHGLSDEQAQEVESQIAPGCAVVTVYGEDNPDRASELLDGAKAHVVTSSEMPEAVNIASASPRTGVDREERKEADRERKPDRNNDRDRADFNGNRNGFGTGAPDRVGVTSDRMGASTDRTLNADLDDDDFDNGTGTADRATYESDVFYLRS